MEYLFFDDVRKNPSLIPLLITGSFSGILLLNLWGLTLGITNVLPHFFYIPIILTAYYYPQRGVYFALFLAVCYGGISLAFVSLSIPEILAMIERAGIFIIIGGVVSYLSGRIHHDTRMCRRLVSVVRSSGDAIISETPEGIITDWNAGAEHLYGYSPDEMVGSSIFRLIPADRKDENLQLLEKVRSGEIVEHVDTERITKGGTRIPVSVSLSPIHDETGAIIGVSAIAHDLTRRKRDEAELRRLSSDYRTIIDNAPAMIWYKDTKNNFIRVNPAAARAFGLPVERIEGKSGYDLFPDHAEKYYRDDLDVITSGNPKTGIIEPMRTASGEHLWMQTDKIPLRNEQGAITGILVFAIDITERKRIEDELALASKKLNLLSSITRHDINNQLTALNAYLHLSRDSIDNPAELRDYFTVEQNIANAIASQISFTKDYENMGVKAPAWQNVNAVIRRSITQLPMREVRVDTIGPDVDLLADPLLEKVFYNLIDNALRYAGEKMSTIRVSTREERGDLVIAVEDDGVGISAGDKELIFTKGFGKHTGLGLYLSSEILSITGSAITENGTPGAGARFEIMVPKGTWRIAGSS
jgi:PAS domain S-box-containing protein